MTPKEECQVLMSEMLDFAKQMLSRHREFYPFGGYMKADGAITHVGVRDEKTEHPKSKPLIETLKQSFREMAESKGCKATAIVFDVLITPPGGSEKTSAIQVNLDHQDGYSAEVFFPYALHGSQEIVFGKTFAQRGNGEIFRT